MTLTTSYAPTDDQKRWMLETIHRLYPVESWKGKIGAFEVLIETILSQNTNDRNRDRAMENLRRRFRITPKVLAKANVRAIAACIKPAGLYREKAPRIRGVSKLLLSKYNGSLDAILAKPKDEARAELMSLPGVGPKTADILLAFVAGHSVIPIDTHITRISKRLAVAGPKAGYDEIQRNLERLIPPTDRHGAHLSIIRFGREVCNARKPRCPICPVNQVCPSSTVRS